ncbi:hypothetical protein KP79_PYT04574 [Mizuhopecten yessoensis]|uniref:Retrotransposon gag domain-containing protein n=1 Tax=Mizuhopecten yessoensis TaxID=6573 RepID=A0A210QWY2_MIZYE|nr:hypothetical protein KP79_PYT04574 [Mizuhopecten yessoensis]
MSHDKLVAAFSLLLKGPAKTWFENLQNTQKHPWTALLAHFKQKFVDLTARSPRLLLETDTFTKMSLQQDQKLDDFYSVLIHKGKLLKRRDEEILLKFVDSLPDTLKFYVRTTHPKTCEAAFNAAKMGEAFGYRTTTNTSSLCATHDAE